MPPQSIPGRLETRWIDAQEWGLRCLARLTGRRRRGPATAPHLATGLRGEQAALFELRRRGYVVVAHRWTSPKVRGDLDLVAWREGTLHFIEVKSRTARDMTPAESAVDEDKRQTIRRLARLYLHTFPAAERPTLPVRFSVLSVYLLPDRIQETIRQRTEFQFFPEAFGWR